MIRRLSAGDGYHLVDNLPLGYLQGHAHPSSSTVTSPGGPFDEVICSELRPLSQPRARSGRTLFFLSFFFSASHNSNVIDVAWPRFHAGTPSCKPQKFLDVGYSLASSTMQPTAFCIVNAYQFAADSDSPVSATW